MRNAREHADERTTNRRRHRAKVHRETGGTKQASREREEAHRHKARTIKALFVTSSSAY